jgi:hypothetical protein
MLSDPEQGAYDSELFLNSLASALDAILPWFPKTAISTITGTGAYTYTLPDDYYRIETCVNDADGEMLPSAMLISGNFRGDDIQGTNDWIEYPHGSITFSKSLDTGQSYTLFYLAHWTRPTINSQDEEVLETPDFLDTALALYTTAQMLLPQAVSASEVRQFNTRVDSGNPEHNPMQESTKFLLRLFNDEMNRHPKYQKAQR